MLKMQDADILKSGFVSSILDTGSKLPEPNETQIIFMRKEVTEKRQSVLGET